jgi:pimeloyl-ACP methyl ester carboxylesterase
VQQPEPDDDTGYAVMLFGGGLTSDLHWTVPGSVDTGEDVRKMTLDGEPTRDADTLARALLDAGFTVLRYSGVFEGNPRFTPDPAMRAPVGFEDSVSLARAAMEGFRRAREIPAGGLILLGHSMGATRACLMEDEDIAGFVLLAPAYMSKTVARPSVLSREALSRYGDKGTTEAVWLSPEVAGADRDGDGVCRGWELAARDRSRGQIEIESESVTWRGGLGWPSDRLIERGVPTLALFGGLDPTSVHGPWLEAAAADGRLADCRVVYFPNLGHNLAREVEGRTGPIDPAAIETLIRWLEERFGGRE